jgi:RNA polymerase sigma factor (sigma-70 family)
MAESPPLIDALRRLAGARPDDRSDAELVARFVGGDSAAFAALVHRHGPLVWGACRRRATDLHAAEDAFQTTFLALARNAGSVRRPAALGSWLHRVAVRCTAAGRTPREPMSALPEDLPTRDPGPAAAAAGRDLERVIDAEIDALPDPFRLAFVMCEVEDRTAAEAAEALGCAEGTIESRLTRARERLRTRLGRRGVTVGALAGLGLAADVVPASARSGAVALGTGAVPVPLGRAALADHAARAAVAGPATVGIGLAGSLLLAGLGGLIWALAGGPEDGRMPAGPRPDGGPNAVAAPGPHALPFAAGFSQLPVAEPDRFRRNRDNFPLPPEAVARVGDPWLRHAGTPDRTAFSADGRFLAAGAIGDRWLRVWDLKDHRPRAHLALAVNEEPLALGLSADGGILRAVIRVGAVAHLREYDTFRGLETHRRSIPDPAAVAFDPTADRLALAKDGKVRLIRAAEGSEQWQIDLPLRDPAEVCFAGPDKVAVLPAELDRVRLFDADSGKSAGDLVEPGVRLTKLASSADGRTLAVWQPLKDRVQVWDVPAKQAIHTIRLTYPPVQMALDPAGARLAVFTAFQGAALWDARAAGKPVQVGTTGGTAGRFAPDGSVLAVTAHGWGVTELADAKTGLPTADSPKEAPTPTPLRFRTDGERLVLQGLNRWLDFATQGGDPPTALSPGFGPSELGIMPAEFWATLSADRTLVARSMEAKPGSQAYELQVLDAATQAVRIRIPLESFAQRPAFAPDNKTVYAAVGKHVCGWDVATGRQVLRGQVPAGDLVYRLLVSADGKYLATAVLVLTAGQRADSIQVWDAATGESLISAEAGHMRPFIAFSADGKRFAAAAVPDRPAQHASEVRVWDLDTRAVLANFAGYDGQPAFSPDGRTLAVTRDDRVELVEFATGQVRHAFRHQGPVEPFLAWRPDGRVLAAASPEAPVYLWDVAGDRTGTVPTWVPTQDHSRWAALTGPDAEAAFDALRQLWAHPADAALFLRNRVDADADAVLATRACEALELAAAADGKALLTDWAAGPTNAPRTREARATLLRLAAAAVPAGGRG